MRMMAIVQASHWRPDQDDFIGKSRSTHNRRNDLTDACSAEYSWLVTYASKQW